MLKSQNKKSYITAYLIRGLLRLLIWTCRFKVTGGHHLIQAKEKGPCLIMLWHNRLLLIGPALLKVAPKHVFTAFVSASRDGEIVAQYTTSYKNGRAIRVPHNSKDAALKTMISRLKLNKEVIIVTPDGPRGPVYKVKQGIALAATATSAYVVPFAWNSNRFWEFKSWDKFRIPKPFSTIEATFGEAIFLKEENEIIENTKVLEANLKALS